MNGWAGQILRVDLSKGHWADEELNVDLAEKYIGGRGLASKVLFDEVNPKASPLGPENKLIFMTGPLAGTGAPSACRFSVVAKSPLTGTISCSTAGGFFGPELKFAGYDGIIFEGKAPKPVYLWINNDKIEIRAADHLWGKDVSETVDLIQHEIGDKWQAWDTHVAAIGPAGENLVRFAAIMGDKWRAAARGGMGAVMGSKNLKALAVRGTGAVTVADGTAFKEITLAIRGRIKLGPGTMDGVGQERGVLATRNYQALGFPEWRNIGGEDLDANFKVRHSQCFACIFHNHHCGQLLRVKAEGLECTYEGGQYATHAMLGANCGISNHAALLKADSTCARLGMDTISMGGTMACAMELFERGYLPEKEAGYKLNFGNAQAFVDLVEKTGLRQGLGDVMAEGSYLMAEKYRHPELSMTVKRMELPSADPRCMQGRGLEYATSNRGACHLRAAGMWTCEFSSPGGPLAIEGKVAKCIELQDFTSLRDSTGLCLPGCHYGKMTAEDILSLLEAATGAGYTLESMTLAGARIWNLERLFNLAAGFTARDDTLPKRMLEEPLPSGKAAGQVSRLREMLPEYYKLREWDENGVPTKEKLGELGLSASEVFSASTI